jgi:hypothetical protein
MTINFLKVIYFLQSLLTSLKSYFKQKNTINRNKNHKSFLNFFIKNENFELYYFEFIVYDVIATVSF